MRLCLLWLWLGVGFSVISDSAILHSEPLPCQHTQQSCCKLAAKETVNIYTVIRYAFGALWQCHNLSNLMANLFWITISLLMLFFFQPPLLFWNILLTCSSHPDSRGNVSADATAKNTATRPAEPLCLMYSHIHDTSPTSSLTDTQSFATLKNVYHICLVSLAIILHLHGSAQMKISGFSNLFSLTLPY